MDMLDAMQREGIFYAGPIIADGRIHRFPTENKRKRNGWYVCFGEGGAFGNWSEGITHKWRGSGEISASSQSDIRKQQQATQKSLIKQQEEARRKAIHVWNNSRGKGYSPYLFYKRINAFGIRFDRDVILVPLRDIYGKLWGYQRILPDGKKYFLSGGKAKGCFHSIGAINSNEHIFIAEGYATAASIHIATNEPVAVCLNVGNLEAVASALCRTYPHLSITIAADNDQWKERNIGKETAYRIAGEYGCNVVVPVFHTIEGKPTDFNDLHVLEGLDEVAQQLEGCYA